MDGWMGGVGVCFGGLETVKAGSLGAKPGWEKPERAEEHITEKRRRAKKRRRNPSRESLEKE